MSSRPSRQLHPARFTPACTPDHGPVPLNLEAHSPQASAKQVRELALNSRLRLDATYPGPEQSPPNCSEKRAPPGNGSPAPSAHSLSHPQQFTGRRCPPSLMSDCTQQSQGDRSSKPLSTLSSGSRGNPHHISCVMPKTVCEAQRIGGSVSGPPSPAQTFQSMTWSRSDVSPSPRCPPRPRA